MLLYRAHPTHPDLAPFVVAARASYLYNRRFVLQGRSSVVEQRPFKPKVVGSIPTAPTKSLGSRLLGSVIS
jgi:hypothetical protein